jgi:Uma2 family endonuclease
MTTDELVALPDDGIDRWLVRGALRARQRPRRTPAESSAIAAIAAALSRWAKQTSPPTAAGLIDVYHRLVRDPDTTLEIDVSLVRKEQSEAAKGQAFVEGPPLVAVKVLSPSGTRAKMTDEVAELADAGVGLVWVVDPSYGTVWVVRPGKRPELLSREDVLNAEPELAGFRVPVAELFE